MPPSYSMMLPGRMSTPLIFMEKLVGLEDCGAALATRPAPGKERVGIDRRALPPALVGAHAVDGEMEVRAFRIGVAGAADTPDRVAAGEALAFAQVGRIALQMRIIKSPL